MKRRVVVTGVGLVTPLGTGVEKSWKNICAGTSGVGLISRFDTSDFLVKIAACSIFSKTLRLPTRNI